MPSRTEVKALLNAFDARPRRDLGQHFLLTDRTLKAIVRDAQVSRQDQVLEIGAGFGALTKVLAHDVKQVIAVELDEKIASCIAQYVLPSENVTVVREDILRFLNRDPFPISGPYAVVANLPYQITSRVVAALLDHHTPPSSITVLVQKEVAERMVAPTGKRSLLSLAVQLGSTPRITRTVGAKQFFPKPRVDSAVIHLGDIPSSPQRTELTPEERGLLFRLARVTFAARRKQIQNTLRNGLHVMPEIIDALLQESNVPKDSRPQSLTIEQWLTLAKNAVRLDIDTSRRK